MSAGQNGACLIKMAREDIGLQPRSKVILRHAQQDFDTISSEVFLLSIFARARKNLCYQGKEGVVLQSKLPYMYTALTYFYIYH